jgi:hypothetical protein
MLGRMIVSLIKMNLKLLLLFLIVLEANAIVEPGYETFEITLGGSSDSHKVNYTKSMYPGTSIILQIQCDSEKDEEATFNLKAQMVYHRCKQPPLPPDDQYSTSITEIPCHKSVYLNEDQLAKIVAQDMKQIVAEADIATATNKIRRAVIPPPVTTAPKITTPPRAKLPDQPAKVETNKNKLVVPPATKPPTKLSKAITKNSNGTKKKIGENHLPLTEVKAIYRIQLSFSSEKALKLKVRVDAKWKGEYLSVLNWPLLPFYGIMSLVYLAFAIGWFTASCCNWRDLLRVQFWIGGVIAIGMFENALFYSEYQSINHNGKENGLLYFAEIVSCMKRALARVLVIIVSMGFGIVKPRLGQMLHKVIAAGTLYFILGSIEGCIRVRDERLSKTKMYALIPLTVLDVSLCWWVFSSLVQTTRTLRIRKNVIKLTLYRHFTNTLIFTVIASLAYMAWTIKQNNFEDCIDIGTVWLNDALWPFLFTSHHSTKDYNTTKGQTT